MKTEKEKKYEEGLNAYIRDKRKGLMDYTGMFKERYGDKITHPLDGEEMKEYKHLQNAKNTEEQNFKELIKAITKDYANQIINPPITEQDFLRPLITNGEKRLIYYKKLLEEVHRDKITWPPDDEFVKWFKDFLRDNKNEEEQLLKKYRKEMTYANQGLNPPRFYPPENAEDKRKWFDELRATHININKKEEGNNNISKENPFANNK